MQIKVRREQAKRLANLLPTRAASLTKLTPSQGAAERIREGKERRRWVICISVLPILLACLPATVHYMALRAQPTEVDTEIKLMGIAPQDSILSSSMASKSLSRTAENCPIVKAYRLALTVRDSLIPPLS